MLIFKSIMMAYHYLDGDKLSVFEQSTNCNSQEMLKWGGD